MERAIHSALGQALGPIQQAFTDFKQREQERSLPPIQTPAFAAVHAALRLLPAATQTGLQPFYLALRAADSAGTEGLAFQTLEQLVQFCVDRPGATAHELQQQVQLQAAQQQVNPLLGLLSGNPALGSGLLSSLLGTQPSSQQPAASPAASGLECYRCGYKGHLANGCAADRDRDGYPIVGRRLKYATPSWASAHSSGQDARKLK